MSRDVHLERYKVEIKEQPDMTVKVYDGIWGEGYKDALNQAVKRIGVPIPSRWCSIMPIFFDKASKKLPYAVVTRTLDSHKKYFIQR